jgi:protein-tyrosine phosphatase
MQIPGIHYREINLNGRGFERSLVWQLKPASFAYGSFPTLRFPSVVGDERLSSPKDKIVTNSSKFRQLIWLMLLGYRMEAISILGKEVMKPRGLIGLGKDSLDYCVTEMAEVCTTMIYPYLTYHLQFKYKLNLIFILDIRSLRRAHQLPNSHTLHTRQRPHRPRDIPTSVHARCANRGYKFRLPFKRRRVCSPHLLLLTLFAHLSVLGLSNTHRLLPEKDVRMAEITSIGLTEEFATCPPSWINSIHAYLEEKYGGVIMYMRMIGVSAGDEDGIRGVLQARK